MIVYVPNIVFLFIRRTCFTATCAEAPSPSPASTHTAYGFTIYTRKLKYTTKHTLLFQTLQASFAEEGNTRGSPGLAPPWASSAGEGGTFINRIAASQSYFADSLKNSFEGAGVTAATAPKSAEISTPATTWNHARAISEVDAAIHALKLAVVGVTRRLMDDVNRLPLRNRTTAVLVDGSRMSLLALELAGAAWKFGR